MGSLSAAGSAGTAARREADAAVDTAPRALLAALADLLSYPGPATRGLAAETAASLQLADDDAGASFLHHVAGAPVEALQELYGATFDLQPTCAPYVGHQLLGEESGLRGPLLARLVAIYRRDGFAPQEELPDHVAEVLRYLSRVGPSAERDDLVRDGLLPALRKMIACLEDEGHPYRDALALTERVVRALPLAGEGGAP